MKLVHMELKEANAFVEKHHRHHKPIQGHRFSIGATIGGVLVGVCIVGRPVARMIDQKNTLEVTRLCTNGTSNCCSFLYAAARRAGISLGYCKIQTYILQSETGVSLTASGWVCEDNNCGGGTGWQSRKGRRNDQPIEMKSRWAAILNNERYSSE